MDIVIIFNVAEYDIKLNELVNDGVIKIPAKLPRYETGDKIDLTDNICSININGVVKIKYINEHIHVIIKKAWVLINYDVIDNVLSLYLTPPEFITIYPGDANKYTYIKLYADIFKIDYDNITYHGNKVYVPINGTCDVSTNLFNDERLIYCSHRIFGDNNYKYVPWKDGKYYIDVVNFDIGDYILWNFATQYEETIMDVKNKYGYINESINGKFIIECYYDVTYISICSILDVVCIGFKK